MDEVTADEFERFREMFGNKDETIFDDGDAEELWPPANQMSEDDMRWLRSEGISPE